ncbi:MAG: choice-of-anchor I family protein [Thermoleophilia bacterium]
MTNRLRSGRTLGVLVAAGAVLAPSAISAPPSLSIDRLGTYATGLGDASGETAAVERDRMFVTNSDDNSLDIVDVADPAAPRLVTRLDLSPYGDNPTSVDVDHGLVAVAVAADPKTDNGRVAFFRTDGTPVGSAEVGALPDMVTFAGNGARLLVANEGEPNSYGQPDSVDPEGSVSIINTSGYRGFLRMQNLPGAVRTVAFTDFNDGGRRHGQLPAGIRLNGPGASVAEDLEPEYITVQGGTAYVTLQENNAVAAIDINRGVVRSIMALGTKDHSLPGNGIDASDRDGGINIARWPVKGMFMPDSLASFTVRGRSYIITANEGDGRDYDGFVDEARVKDLTLDPVAFPNAADLQKNENLGRLTVSATDGKNADGSYSALYSFGARSATIWTTSGKQVWDSGDLFERVTAERAPDAFNTTNDELAPDSRSDNKGPEPEGVAVGTVRGRSYAFVGLERIGGVMVLDVSKPDAPVFIDWVVNRDFTADPVGPDSGPEIIRFIDSSESPTRQSMLMVANEVSGTVSLYDLGGRQGEDDAEDSDGRDRGEREGRGR